MIKESDHARQLMKWVRLHEAQHPELRLFFHVPNEGRRTGRAGAHLVRQGLRAGVSDYILPVARMQSESGLLYSALMLELKRPEAAKKKDKGLSKTQKEWFVLCRRFGLCAAVGFGWQDSASKILRYLQMSKPRCAELENTTFEHTGARQ